MIIPESPILIVISGGSCSGKSYLANILAGAINPFMRISCIGLDNYFKDIDDPSLPRNAKGSRLFDRPDSYHCEEFVSHVSDLMSGKSISMPIYDQVSCRRISGQYLIIELADIIVAEGLFAITILKNIKKNKINVYVDASEKIRLERRTTRDILRYGVSEDVVVSKFFEKVKPCHTEFVEPQKNIADIVLMNNQKGGESNGR